jgi:hypothetical protein
MSEEERRENQDFIRLFEEGLEKNKSPFYLSFPLAKIGFLSLVGMKLYPPV